jgi:oligopeptide/dipeptide ABC transporter ATP-binding protein
MLEIGGSKLASEPLLRIDNLKKHFPVRSRGLFSKRKQVLKAVDGVSFAINTGETLAIVGESGCGKSTTANVILGLEKPTSGEVLMDGKNVHALSSADYQDYRRRMQAVFQDPWSSLNPRMRVSEIVSEPLLVNRPELSRKERINRVHKVLEDVGLNPKLANRYPHEFSGGQRQRIAVAAALISQPDIIILDEPVSALDVSIRAQIMNMFRDIQEQYRLSYLLIAHDLGTTRYMANKIAVYYLGKIVEYGSTEDVFENPLHPYTQALFSASLPSHPDIHREEIILKGEVPSPINPPSGCPFHVRCPMKIGDVCSAEVPTLGEETPGHFVSCHIYEASGTEKVVAT